ncbi:unnamed protein product, partial [Meganyctiphanes norvegica]
MAPPRGTGDPTIVFFHVTVMSLDSIDESSMTYAADIFFAQSWKDDRLRLPDNMTHDYRLLPVAWLKDIWRPDSFFKNAKAVTFQEMTIPNHYIWLYKDQTILYMVKLTLVLSCAMNFQRYPHDTQECTMKIESLSHTTDDLVFMWDPEVALVVDHRIELPQLDLVRNVTGDCTQVYSTGNFTCLEIIFTFKRRLGYYLFHTYIPTCLIVIMSWISFWIRPEAVPARVTLGVTSLLTLSTQHANSQKSLPPVSYIKAIDVFMSSCTVFVFFSLMEYALVNVLLGDMTEKGPAKDSIVIKLDKCPEITITRRMPGDRRKHNGRKVVCQQTEYDNPPSATTSSSSSAGSPQGYTAVSAAPPPRPVQQRDRKGRSYNNKTEAMSPNHPRRDTAIMVDRVSRVLFPLSFTVLNIVYWSIRFKC